MGYAYGYGYGIGGGNTPAQLYAGEQSLKYIQRVIADGGIVQSQQYVYDYYLTAYFEQFTEAQWRRHYHALAGVKLNNVDGLDYVQEMYDLNPFTQINAVQANAANQPLWDTDTDVPYRVPRYNGTSQFMSIADLSIYNEQPAGTLMAVAKDTNLTGGSTIHYIVGIMGNGNFSRATLATRNNTNNAAIISRRLDAGTTTFLNAPTNYSGFRNSVGIYNWVGNLLNFIIDSSSVIQGALLDGGGSTSNTNSNFVNIGAFNNGTVNTFFPGVISSVQAFRAVLTTAQLEAFRNLEKKYNGGLP
jgi:hypothetical protein